MDAAAARRAGSVDRRGAATSGDGLRAAGGRPARAKAGVPAACAGSPRSGADGARGLRSLHAPSHIAVSDPVDAVAGVAITGVQFLTLASVARHYATRA